ncbi:CDGSH iron-sulfur domain-containing protein [Sphingobacterium daejeonense]|uniref:CDGSH iron-sulfur domain-containing protein n=1 Tax=Sphingobacterium daejeonense TaxID=371142 RepID=UPI0021A47B76|nr:CDGSH iron-sulfur domain-containing protein [Sphingobacterium daejeonense]MCT1530362.1 CDGSH iron-sulfur domain-containing protein [Sphingobacterium daejeonense]
MELEKDQLDVQLGTETNTKNIYIEVTADGPYLLHGQTRMVQQFILANPNGISVAYKDGATFKAENETYLCRCGLSKNKPYCDNSHLKAKQNGVDLTETATFNPEFATAEIIEGPVVSLSDDEKLCAYARFCDNGRRIWNEVQESNQESVELSVGMAHHCPSGRLIVWDGGTPIEDKDIEPTIGLIEDMPNNCSGPIALWGGIPVKSSNGKYYEVRNRQTLCRCGQSTNKPFCDGTHASMKFQDGLDKEPDQNGKTF